jgi:hypothetical protein
MSLYISFQNDDGSWTQPQNLGDLINTSGTDVWPHLSPDNKYLFFVSERTGDNGFNPYWVSTKFIDKLCPPTSVRDGMGSLPAKFKLYFNYPNPFNPVTTITYDMPVKSVVQLDIYNVLGVFVKRLVNETQDAGNYSVPWDGTDNSEILVSSGLYFYKLTSGTNSQINKALLVK